MDKFEKRTNCLLCVQELPTEKNRRSLQFKKATLLINTSSVLCKVLNLPLYPFLYFFTNAGYCFCCKKKVEELELLSQKLLDIRKKICEIRNEFEISVTSVYKTKVQSFENTSESVSSSIIGGVNDENLLKDLTFPDVLRCLFEQFNERERKSTRASDSIEQGNSHNRGKKINKEKSISKSAVTTKIGNKAVFKSSNNHLNPIVLLEKLSLNNIHCKSIEKRSTNNQVSKNTISYKKESNEGQEEPALTISNDIFDESYEDDWQNEFIDGEGYLDEYESQKEISKGKDGRNNNPGRELSCPVSLCSEKVNSKVELKTHFLEKHPDYKFQCDECDKKYINKKHLLDHKKTKHSNVIQTFNCDLCPNTKFSYAKGLKAHRIKKHRNVFPELCQGRQEKVLVKHHTCQFENCSETFVEKLDLKAHIGLAHKGEKRFQCDQCDNKYKLKKYLKLHKISKHSGTVNAPHLFCDKCEKSFSSLATLEVHNQLKHSGECKFRCRICSKGFNDRIDMDQHFKIHQEPIPFRCSTCDKVFTNTLDLKYHLRTHDINQTTCDVCNKIFSSEKNLKDHKLMHNDISLWPKCTICQKPFKSERHLRKHSIVHSENNKYKCDECGMDFKYSSYLLKHKRRVHCTEKPFCCSICGKGFYETQQMKRHEEIHSGLKQYVCDICGKTFRTLQNHYQHSRSHSESYRKQRSYNNLRRRAIKSKTKRKNANIMKREIKLAASMIFDDNVPDIPANQIIEFALNETFPEHSVEVEVETKEPSPKHRIEFEVETIYDDDPSVDIVSHSLAMCSEQSFSSPIADSHIQTYVKNGETIIVVNNLDLS